MKKLSSQVEAIASTGRGEPLNFGKFQENQIFSQAFLHLVLALFPTQSIKELQYFLRYQDLCFKKI